MNKSIQDIYPLTSTQQGMLFHGLYSPGSQAYLLQLGCDLGGDMNAEAFRRAWEKLVERHAILRTSFLWEGVERPVQVVHEKVILPWREEDWQGKSAEEQEQAWTLLLAEDRQDGFDFGRAPLTRLTLVRLDSEQYRLVWTTHHILLDGWTVQLLIGEVLALYEGYRDGRELQLVSPPPYRNYIAWLQRQDPGRSEQFWRARLQGFTAATPLPTDRVLGQREDSEKVYGEWCLKLSPELTAGLESVARTHQVTLNTVMQGAWAILLSRYSGEEDVLFGTTVSGRSADVAGIESMIGLFINTLPVRMRVQQDETLASYLKRLQAEQMETLDYEHSPLVQIQSWSEVPPGTPLFDSILVYENHPADGALRRGGISPLKVDAIQSVDNTHYPLTLLVLPGEELRIEAKYDARRFDEAIIAHLLGHLETLLEGMAQTGPLRIRELRILRRAECEQLVVQWNQTERQYPSDKCVHTLFEEQVERSSQAIAVMYDDEELSYDQLNRRSNQLAHYLRNHGAGPESRIGLCMERSVEMVIGLLGILKAGGAYVPLDPQYPSDRLRYMAEDAGLEMIVTTQEPEDGFTKSAVPIISLDRDSDRILECSDASPVSGVTSSNLIYIIYTSGSTGKPKGAMNTHSGLNNRLTWMQAQYGLDPTDRVLQKTPFTFDVSAWEFLWPLIVGSCLIVAAPGEHRNPDYIAEIIRRRSVTTLHFVPSMLGAFLLTQTLDSFPSLQRVICSGELLSVENQACFQKTPWIELCNLYGPTEAAIDVTHWTCSSAWDRKVVPIGRPIANTQIYILDEEMEPAPVGVAGELYIGGAGVGRGYVGRPDLTAERFVPDPYGKVRGSRLYRTGDLARYGRDGVIEFLGRRDDQVKLRGYRIELGEIEAVLREHRSVGQAAVTLREDHRGERRLVAYVVGHGAAVDNSELKEYLRQRLPEYMVPAAWVELEELPLTSNGKLDRKRLPEPEQRDDGRAWVAPRNATEQTLADIWAAVLGRDRISVEDNFFEIGGDSILCIQVVAKSRKNGLHFNPKDLFEQRTIAALASVIGAERLCVKEMPTKEEFPLTPIQEQFFRAKLKRAHHYNQSILLSMQAGVRSDLLQLAAREVFGYHEAFRLRFELNERGWRQTFVNDATRTQYEIVDLSELATDDQHSSIEVDGTRVQKSLDLRNGPLYRIVEYNLGSRGRRLLIVVHHLIIDAVSWGIVLEDLEGAYEELSRGQMVQLQPKTASLDIWSHALQQYGNEVDRAAELQYWDRLGNSDLRSLPLDLEGHANDISSENTVVVTLNAEHTASLLYDLPTSLNCRIDELLLTALVCSICRWANRSELIIDLEGHGREDIINGLQVWRTVGWFTTLYPVLLNTGKNLSLPASLQAIKRQLRPVPNHGFNFGIVRYLGEPVDGSNTFSPAPAQVRFNYLGQINYFATSGIFSFASEAHGDVQDKEESRPYLFDLVASIADRCLRVEWRYSRNLHKQSTVEALSTAFTQYLRELIGVSISSSAPQSLLTGRSLARLPQEVKVDLFPDDNVQDIYPLTSTQEGMLFHRLYSPGSGAYLLQLSCSVGGDMDAEAFRRAWGKLVERHTILRTSFLWEGVERPLQVVHEKASLPWREEDWRGKSAEEQEQAWTLLLAEDRQDGFDFGRAPLTRLTLVRLDSEQYRLVWTTHHILLDGWCRQLLIGEVLALYEGYRDGRELQLVSPPPYRNYIAWLQRQDPGRSEQFWKARLQGFTAATPLPTDRVLGQREDSEKVCGEWCLKLSPGLTARLEGLGRAHQVTLNTVVQGAWAILLSRYSGEEDVLFGATVSGRSADVAGIESMIGLFINTLPVRVRGQQDETLASYLKRLQTDQIETLDYEHSPLVQIQSWSEVPPGTPLFDSILVYENYPADGALGRGDRSPLKIDAIRSVDNTHYPLTLLVLPGEELRIEAKYDARRFDEATIAHLLGHLETLLEGMAQAGRRRIRELPILRRAEREQLVALWNQTDRAYPSDKCVHMLFEEQVERSPEAIAVVYENRDVTYEELNQRSNQLAHYLRNHGAGPESRIGLCMERSVEMVIGLLGILKAGGAYVPLDPQYPPDRLHYMVDDAGLGMIVTMQELEDKFTKNSVLKIRLDKDSDRILECSDVNPASGATSSNLIYIIYTSGSTGRPKGAMNTHSGLNNRLTWMQAQYGLDAKDRVLQKTPFTFDVSAWEFLWPLIAGACLIVAEPGGHRNADYVAQTIRRFGVSIVHFVPSMLSAFLSGQNIASFPSLRHVICSGEPLAADDRIPFEKTPQIGLNNLYGPTEAAIDVTHWTCSSAWDRKVVPIGRPIANTQIYILDEAMEPAPVGVTGELYIGGAGVGRGYVGRPDLTAERFVPDPYGKVRGSRLYRTGDLARYDWDGVIEFLGRRDDQVKLRGYRIELGEIEAVLREHGSVGQAAVALREDQRGDRHLVAYVVGGGAAVDSRELKEYLRQRLPEYMVPAAWVELEELPLTSNGKLDRKRLPEPEQRDDGRAWVAPRNATEQTLADIWAAVLGRDRISVEDNFFEIGGHSLLLLRVKSRIQQTMKRDIAMVDLFSFPKLCDLAACLLTPEGLSESTPVTVPTEQSDNHQKRLLRQRTQHEKQMRETLQLGAGYDN